MTPKEKAKELIEKYGFIRLAEKTCALIAVDEIMKAFNPLTPAEGWDEVHDEIDYWQEVKEEIEKL